MLDKKSIAYLHVHMFYAFWATFFIFWVYSQKMWFVGIIIGVLVEASQMVKGNRFYLADVIIDLISWLIGGLLIFLI